MKLLFEASRELPLVQLGVTFRVGGVHDPVGREGLARLTARMLRRGTSRMSGEILEERVDGIGAELGAHVGLGSTIVGVETVARSLDEATAIVGEVLAEPTFDEAELEKLKRQAEAEIVAARDDDDGLGARALRRELFRGHPHGRRVQGSVASVRAITRADVVAHHRRAYTVDNAVIAIGGAVEEDEARRLAERLVAGLPRGERLDYGVEEPQPAVGRRLVIADKPERSQCQLGIGTLGVKPTDDDYVPMMLANTVFGGMFTSRLNQEIRVKRGWSYGASSGLGSARVREAFTVSSAPAADDAVACLEVQLGLLDALVEGGIEAPELAFARDYARRSYAFEVDTAKKRLQQRLDRALLDLPDDFHAVMLERMAHVTVDETNRALRRRIDPRALWVSAVLTDANLGDAFRSALPWDEVVVQPYDRD
ncbi:MAG: insulinase family protein [Deltaproteobacteria bacterium]|nr:insulinase family protein [Deltaproteobacteria bacterium]